MDSNNQQINTWSGGMNTDTSDLLLNNNQYRFARNLRYVTETEQNTGELHLIPGATLITEITNNIDEGNAQILEATQLRDKAIFIVTYKTGWAVWTIDNWTDLVGEPRKVFYTTDSKRVLGCKLSLVTKYEDEYNLKLYIADRKGPVLVVLLNPKENVTETDDASQISAYPSVLFKKPIFVGFISGRLESGLVQYSYQFYNKYGQQSEISPATKLIPLGYQYGNYNKGYLEQDITDKGVRVDVVVDKDAPFNRIRVFRIQYKVNGQLPTISTIYDEPIVFSEDNQGNRQDTVIIINDVGQSALGNLTLEEYNSITGIHIIPKTIESKEDYLFAGNIKDRSEEFDKSLDGYDFTASSDWENTLFQVGDLIEGSGDIVSWKFIVTELIGDCDNSKDYINSEALITDGLKLYVIENTGTNQFQYTELQDEAISINNANSHSYKDPVISSELKSLRRGETYRYGIVLYNSIGEASSVKWIADIKTPDIDICPTFKMSAVTTNPTISGRKLMIYPLGIKFTINEQSLPESVVSYEIVRCKREFSDMSILALGVLSRPIRVNKDREGNPIIAPFTPTGMITCSDYMVENFNETPYMTSLTETQCPYLFICPECVYDKNFIGTLKSNRLMSLSAVNYIYPLTSFNIPDESNNGILTKWWNIGNDFSNIYMDNGIKLKAGDTLGISYYLKTLEIQDGLDNDDGGTIETRVKNDLSERRNQYIKLYNNDVSIADNVDSNIKDIEISNTLSYNDLATTSGTLTFKDKMQAIGEYTYINWVTQGTYNFVYTDFTGNNAYNDESHDAIYSFIIGPAGTCLLLDVDKNYSTTIADSYGSKAVGTFLCNIKKPAVPYGGSDSQYRKLSTYRSFGDYYAANVDNINVFDGDTFIMPFEYCSIHKWVHPDMAYPRNACTIYSIPVETSINLAYTSGFEFSKELNNVSGDISYIQEEPSNVNNVFVQDTPQYVYNTVYSVSDSPRVFEADDEEHEEMNQDYRVYNSLVKSNNEYIDNWLKFQPANYIDVDSRLGQITGLRRFKNQLVFWQDDATGLISVNERSLITDHDKMPLILGSGDVLSRYDYITTSNGMKVDQYADALSESTLYWWDYVRKELCAYQNGQGYNILSKSKFVQNYINTGDNTDDPKLIFDKQYNELISNVVNDESLIYSELTGNFMSVYNIHPLCCVQLSDKLLIANKESNEVFQWNKSEDGECSVNTEISPDDNNGFPLRPYLEYTVNKGADTTKVFDNGEIAGRFYGGDRDEIDNIRMEFKTPLKQQSLMTGASMTNREYNFRYAIPRAGDAELGNRMRGKSMRASISSDSNSLDFSIQYIMTKFRVSWS